MYSNVKHMRIMSTMAMVNTDAEVEAILIQIPIQIKTELVL